LVPAEKRLIDFITSRRWFASKTREVTHAHVLDSASLHEGEPELQIQIVEVVFDTGTHETYQLLTSGEELDALADPRHVRELVHMIRAGATVGAGEGVLEFRALEGFASLGTELTTARLITSEQSNTSIIFDEEVILKAFRRLEAGVNPELELLRFLTERGFENIAQLGGWYAYVGKPLDATLGVLQQYVRGALDGWELALDELEAEPERFLSRLRRLGQVTGSMHAVLGSNSSDPTFSPEDPSAEALALLTATVDEEISRIFVELPEDVEALDPIRGRGEEVRESLALLSHAGSFGKTIRTHGDLHLGQTLWAQDRGDKGDWVIIDFEGEPARSLAERRRKRSPLRDVAGMLRSFAYAVSAVEILRGAAAPDDWESRAREEFLKGYMETADPSLLPAGDAAFARLLMVFELEKAVYELRYELNNRPEWVHIPVAGILRMLEATAAA
jgi:trehalose synthase-fused probable maltokinase